MSKRSKLFLGLALLVLLVAFPLSVALAQEETPPPEEHTLTANGYGLATFGGEGSMDIHAHGASVIWIRGADTLEITGDGEREDTDDGVVKLTDWEGEIHAEGERFVVRMVGGKLDFTATGKGRAFLQGYGTFQVGDHDGRWSWQGVHIPRRPRRPVIRERLQGLRGRSGLRPGGPGSVPAPDVGPR